MQRFGLPLVHPIPSALGASQETESADQLIDFAPSYSAKNIVLIYYYLAKKLALHRVDHIKLTNCKILFVLNVNTLDLKCWTLDLKLCFVMELFLFH